MDFIPNEPYSKVLSIIAYLFQFVTQLLHSFLKMSQNSEMQTQNIKHTCNNKILYKARQGKFIYIAHFIHNGNSKCFT